jgi:hypothetical protein
MKVAHLILTHKNPLQVERLLDALSHPEFDFYIHIDKKTDLTPFLYLEERKNVFFIKERAAIYWAGYGTIQATLNGFRQILRDKTDPGKPDHDKPDPGKSYPGEPYYINVISGQDFPLRAAADIYNYLLERKGKEFITCESIDNEWSEAAPRVRNYHLINWRIPGKHRLEKWITRLLPPRKFPLDYKIVGRANWFTLTTGAAHYILDFIKQHPAVDRYFYYCWGADEFFFSTILFNSPFGSSIEDNLVYVDWSEKKAHPKILTAADFGAMRSSSKLFARKLDINTDPSIFDLLENATRQDKTGQKMI